MRFENFLNDFKALGGFAKNIVCLDGKYGRGLFANDPNSHIQIHVPPNLLIESKYIELDNQKNIKVSEKAPNRKELKSLYENFHRYFGWGAGGSENLRNFYQDVGIVNHVHE
jgi:hypothetical protein